MGRWRPIGFAAAAAWATPAWADCPTANRFAFDWNSQPVSTLAYNASYSYQASNAAVGGRSFTAALAQNGLTGMAVSGTTTPTIRTVNTATTGATEHTLSIGGVFGERTTSLAGTARVASITFTFAAPVRDLSFRVHDIDFAANSFRDWVSIVGRLGTNTYFPTITRPAASGVRVGPSATAPTLAAGELLGTVTSAQTEDGGTVAVAFAQPVTSVAIRYGNYPLQLGETATGEQWISIHDMTFCPMPVLSVAKSSAPLATTGANRFNAPGEDVVYSLVVANAGGSPVDLNGTTLTDALPPGVSFFNGDFDGAGPGTTPFELVAGTSGLTLAAANASYSNNGGTSFAYVPAAGYDPAVNTLRLAPGGSMAANSSFTIRFRARIK